MQRPHQPNRSLSIVDREVPPPPHGRLSDTELALAATIAELVEKLPTMSSRNAAMFDAIERHGSVMLEALIELRDVRTALQSVKERLLIAERESNAFNEPLASIHESLKVVNERVAFVLRD